MLRIIIVILEHLWFAKNSNQKHFNFRKANFLNLYNELCSTDWSVLQGINDTNLLRNSLYVNFN